MQDIYKLYTNTKYTQIYIYNIYIYTKYKQNIHKLFTKIKYAQNTTKYIF